LQAAKLQRRPPPEHLQNPPEVSDDNALAWRCFWNLRRGVDSLMPLRWKDIALWAHTYGCDVDMMEGVQQRIVILDAVYVPFMTAKAKAAQGNNNGNAPRNRRN
jgi:hypothetical protein